MTGNVKCDIWLGLKIEFPKYSPFHPLFHHHLIIFHG